MTTGRINQVTIVREFYWGLDGRMYINAVDAIIPFHSNRSPTDVCTRADTSVVFFQATKLVSV